MTLRERLTQRGRRPEDDLCSFVYESPAERLIGCRARYGMGRQREARFAGCEFSVGGVSSTKGRGLEPSLEDGALERTIAKSLLKNRDRHRIQGMGRFG